MRTFLWSALFLLVSGCLFAQDDWKGDGSSLLTKCSLALCIFDGEKLSSADVDEGGFCVGYIWGNHDTDYMVQMLEEHEKVTLMKHACPPSFQRFDGTSRAHSGEVSARQSRAAAPARFRPRHGRHTQFISVQVGGNNGKVPLAVTVRQVYSYPG